MVSPKHKAIQLTNREEIKSALLEFEKYHPNKDKIKLLIKSFNEVHGADLIQWSSYTSCNDCKIALRDFWKYVVKEWQKI